MLFHIKRNSKFDMDGCVVNHEWMDILAITPCRVNSQGVIYHWWYVRTPDGYTRYQGINFADSLEDAEADGVAYYMADKAVDLSCCLNHDYGVAQLKSWKSSFEDRFPGRLASLEKGEGRPKD
jgi:hypothetical protein